MASGRSRKPSKRSGSPSGSPFTSKKRRPHTPLIADDVDSPSSTGSPASFTTNNSEYTTANTTVLAFKDANFEHSGSNNTKRKGWKNLKQILTIERGLPWKQDDPTYGSIDAPPSFKPAKKYSDLSGFPAKYKDPRTGIRYCSSTEFSTIRNLPSDIVTEDEILFEEMELSSMSSSNQEQTQTKSYELFERDALGRVLTELFQDPVELFGVPEACNPRHFELLSVFVKDNRNRFTYVGHLDEDGGILRDKNASIGAILRPHLHRSTKQSIDRYLTEKKHPFTQKITEFTSGKLNQRPEGKSFSWLDMGLAQLFYVDIVKLSAKLEQCHVDITRPCLEGKGCLYIVHKNCQTERLHFYSSVLYKCSSWLGKDTAAIETQIKNATKSGISGPCIVLDGHVPRAFSFCKVPVSKDGILGIPDFDVKLVPTNPFEQAIDELSFFAEELDFEFTSWLISRLKEMRTREIWQPAIKELYTALDTKERYTALEFLLGVVRKFQTEEEQVVQMVDLSFAITNIPVFLHSHPSILSRILRGASIVVTEPSTQDSDDEDCPEPQIVFRPANCQENLRTMEFLLTLLVKGVVTDRQCEAAATLLSHEVTTLQELFFTQMGCICAPWKSLNPKEEPMVTLWKKGTRTRLFLESLGLSEQVEGQQKVVHCPKNCQLLNVLSIFYKEVD